MTVQKLLLVEQFAWDSSSLYGKLRTYSIIVESMRIIKKTITVPCDCD